MLVAWGVKTYAVMLMVGLVLVFGVLLLGRRRPVEPPRERTCPAPHCGHANPPAARYCAACGRKLPDHAAS